MFKKIQRLDDKVIDNIIKIRSPWKNRIMIAFSSVGNMGLIWFAFCMPFLIYAPWRMTGVNIIFALSFNQILSEIILKQIIRRERPVWHLADEEQLIHRPKYYSFPSGHTAASFAVLGVTALKCGPITVTFVLFLAIMIAFSRLYLRVHYLSDVIAGMILGFIFGSSSVAIFDYFVRLWGITI